MESTLSSFLKEKLAQIQKRNARFSLRSLAAKVDIPPGAMAELMKGKRALSDSYAAKIAKGLVLPPSQRKVLFSFVSTRSRKLNKQKILNEKELKLITGWEHYAILNLMKTDDFQSDPSWIASRLGLSQKDAEHSLRLLLELGLIAYQRDQLVRTFESLNTTQEIPSKALVKAHQQDLQKASDILEATEPIVRSYTSTTMAINTKKLKEAKTLIKQFHRRMCNLLEDGNKDEVYNLNIQLFPISIIDSKPIKAKGT